MRIAWIMCLALWAIQCGPPAAEAPQEQASGPSESPTLSHPLIELREPAAGAVVSFRLQIAGRARGPWFFEGSFPVRLETPEGDTLLQSYIQAEGAWMTEDWVNFSGTLSRPDSLPTEIILLLCRANPSGLPENSAGLRIPLQTIHPPE